MAEYVGPAGFNTILRDLTRRVAALENGVRASRTTVRNGLLVIADDQGRTTLAIGKQADGRVALRVFDPATGVVRLRMGEQPDGSYSLQALNATGVPQVTLGPLSDGTFGLEQMNAAGQAVSLAAIALGSRSETVTGTVATQSTSWVDLGGPTVVVTVPSSGVVEVGITSQVAVPTTGGYGDVGVSLDGGAPIRLIGCYSVDAAIFAAAGSRRYTGLTPGDHTFRLDYRVGPSPTGDTQFTGRTISVRPY